ncbi:MAG: hypothetical protein QOD00_1957 [Blastocatellia bacterium]|jgi:hypothetical protein|nr:hypothetical protein [Blastocatellia bacterium]
MIRVQHLTLALCVALMLAFSSDMRGQSTAPVNSLDGIWSSETAYGPALRGELIVRREGASWRATLSSAEAGFNVTGDSVRFAFPGNQGQFRGTLAEKGDVITGFWLQPEGAVMALSTAQRFATPLVLRRAGRGVWRGTVRSLDNRFTLYLKIFQDADGALIGAFRNPDQNSRGGTTQFRVSREGNSVVFSARSRARFNSDLTIGT